MGCMILLLWGFVQHMLLLWGTLLTLWGFVSQSDDGASLHAVIVGFIVNIKGFFIRQLAAHAR
jgi:hypothetical protein